MRQTILGTVYLHTNMIHFFFNNKIVGQPSLRKQTEEEKKLSDSLMESSG